MPDNSVVAAVSILSEESDIPLCEACAPESGVVEVEKISELRSRASQIHISGLIAGERYIAAATCGNGACALHAVLGYPTSPGGVLMCSDVRERLLACIPCSVQGIMELFSGALRPAFLPLLEHVWQELAMPAARAWRDNGNFAGCSAEAKCLWKCLPPVLQEDLESFVQFQSYEAQVKELRTARALRFARELFRIDLEETLVRPLSLLVGYLSTTSAHVLELEAGSAAAEELEGPVGGLELLHPCREQPDLTKYQALFNADPAFDRYRLAFLLNAAHAGGRCQENWMLNALETLAEEEATRGRHSEAELLREGRSALAARQECFGGFVLSCELHVGRRLVRTARSHAVA